MTTASNLVAHSTRPIGTAANNLLALDGSGKIPVVDASQVTGLTAAQISGLPVQGGMTLLGSTTSLTTASYTLSGLTLTGYKQLFVVFNTLMGGTAGGWNNLWNGNAIGSTGQGKYAYGFIQNDLVTGIAVASGTFGTSSAYSSTSVNGALTQTLVGGYMTAATSVSFSTNSTAYTSGSVYVYGVK